MAEYTPIDDPSAFFNAVAYTGDGSSDHAITFPGNSDLQPDLLWYKSTSHETSHILYDTSRGVDLFLTVNTTAKDKTDAQMLESFDSNGFTLNGDTDGNRSGGKHIAFGWKVNGGTTANATATAGNGQSNASVTQVNSTSKCSIFTYSGSSNTYPRIKHNLGTKADFYIIKCRTQGPGSAMNWMVYHKDSAANPERTAGILNDTSSPMADNTTFWAAEDSGENGLITMGGASQVWYNGEDFIGYAFAEVQGFSRFGRYKGNGQTNGNGPFVWCGFKPKWLMIKPNSGGVAHWLIHSNTLAIDGDVGDGNQTNVMDDYLYANSTSGRGASSTVQIDFVSGGFKIRGNNVTNFGNTNYVFMAFAERPFVSGTGVPGVAV